MGGLNSPGWLARRKTSSAGRRRLPCSSGCLIPRPGVARLSLRGHKCSLNSGRTIILVPTSSGQKISQAVHFTQSDVKRRQSKGVRLGPFWIRVTPFRFLFRFVPCCCLLPMRTTTILRPKPSCGSYCHRTPRMSVLAVATSDHVLRRDTAPCMGRTRNGRPSQHALRVPHERTVKPSSDRPLSTPS